MWAGLGVAGRTLLGQGVAKPGTALNRLLAPHPRARQAAMLLWPGLLLGALGFTLESEEAGLGWRLLFLVLTAAVLNLTARAAFDQRLALRIFGREYRGWS